MPRTAQAPTTVPVIACDSDAIQTWATASRLSLDGVAALAMTERSLFRLRKREAMLGCIFDLLDWRDDRRLGWESRAMSGGGAGSAKAKREKSFRETLKLLKSLKTTKSDNFAGETISFRLGFVLGSREIFTEARRRAGRGKNLEITRKSFFARGTH
jgi:hypothetical protein